MKEKQLRQIVPLLLLHPSSFILHPSLCYTYSIAQKEKTPYKRRLSLPPLIHNTL